MSITSRKVQRSPFEWRSQAILNYSSVIPREVPGILITSYELNWMVLCCGSCTIFHEETRGMSFIVNMRSWIKQTFCFLNRGRNEDGNVKEKEANCLHQVWCIKICSKIWPSHNHSKYPVSPYSTYKLNKLNDSYAPKYRTKGADTFSCVAVEISLANIFLRILSNISTEPEGRQAGTLYLLLSSSVIVTIRISLLITVLFMGALKVKVFLCFYIYPLSNLNLKFCCRRVSHHMFLNID